MPALPSEDYEALKVDIAARGVMVAIEVDERIWQHPRRLQSD